MSEENRIEKHLNDDLPKTFNNKKYSIEGKSTRARTDSKYGKEKTIQQRKEAAELLNSGKDFMVFCDVPDKHAIACIGTVGASRKMEWIVAMRSAARRLQQELNEMLDNYSNYTDEEDNEDTK